MVAAQSGLFEVTIVKYGTRSTVKSDVYLNFGIYGEDDAPIDMHYYFWVLRNGEQTIVVDTGFSKHGGQARQRTFLIDPAKALAALGVDADAAPHVIVTHAHYDHIGNLPLFPRSRLTMARREFEFWSSDFAARRQYRHSVEPDELDHLGSAFAEGRVELFDGRLELTPGVDLIEVGGHTPGQVVVKVATTEGVVLLASDAVHYYEEYERDFPFAFVSDLQAMYRGFDLIRSMVDSGEVEHLVAGHDPDTLNRFTPVETGELAGLASTIGSAVNAAHDR